MASDATNPVPLAPGPVSDPSRAPRRRRWRLWVIAAVAAWGALLVGLAFVSVHRDPPTVREQRSLAEAAPVVQRALHDVVAAAGPDVAVESPAPVVEHGCRLSVVRDGAILDQQVIFRTADDADGPDLLDRIAEHLPARYGAAARHSADGTTHTLRADAGEFVLVKGQVTDPGVVTITATTGCRPAPPDFTVDK